MSLRFMKNIISMDILSGKNKHNLTNDNKMKNLIPKSLKPNYDTFGGLLAQEKSKYEKSKYSMIAAIDQCDIADVYLGEPLTCKKRAF